MTVAEADVLLTGSSKRVAVTSTGSMRTSWAKVTREKEHKMKKPKRGRIFIDRRKISTRRVMG
jgi:hypothetical protein